MAVTIEEFWHSNEFGPVQKVTCSDEKEWLKERRKDLTASDFGAVLGLNPWSNTAEILERKRTGVQRPMTELMLQGIREEGAIARISAIQNKISIEPCNFYLRAPDLRIGASIDYLYSYQGQPVPYEIKQSGTRTINRQWGSGVPGYVRAQVGVQCMLLNQSRFGFVCLYNRDNGDTSQFVLEFKERDWKQYAFTATRFWELFERRKKQS